jgi:hypothetical protein
MTARILHVGLSVLSRWSSRLLVANLAVTLLAGSLHAQQGKPVAAPRTNGTRPQPALYQPPTQPSSSRARLAAWQNEGFEPVPDESMPLDAPMVESAPGAAPPNGSRSGGVQSRLRASSPPNHGGSQGDYVSQSIDQWIQHDGNACCGPACGPGCGCGTCNTCCFPRHCPPFGGYWNCPSPEDPCFQCRPPLWWVKADLLLGFRKGRGYPVLVTTDPSNEDSQTAGALPDATILYDGDSDNTQMRAGLDLEFGTYLNDCQTIGVGGRYFFLGADEGNYATNSGVHAILAVPFTSVALNGANTSLLLAHPDIGGIARTGSVDIRASNEIHGFDAVVKFLYCRNACGKVEFVTGWHTSSVNDFFQMQMRSGAEDLGANQDFLLVDHFNTENQFHGVILGVLTEHQICCMTLRGKARVSVGNMHQVVKINGSTSINGVVDPTQPGGLFSAESNMGEYNQNQFAAVTEAGLSIGYYITPRMQFNVGYNLMYWSNVVRPGEQIDTVIDDLNNPPTRPTFQFNTTSFWVQSITLGLSCEF